MKDDMLPSSVGSQIIGRYYLLPKITAKVLQACALFVLNKVEKGTTFLVEVIELS